jgi:hypothetical protein
MSARFHLYLSGIFERSRSCAMAENVSPVSAAAVKKQREADWADQMLILQF